MKKVQQGRTQKAKRLKWNQKCAILLKNWFKVLSTIFNIYGLWLNGVYYLWMQEYFSIRKSNVKLHMKRLKIKAVHVNRGIIKVLRTFNTWLKSFHKVKIKEMYLNWQRIFVKNLWNYPKKKKTYRTIQSNLQIQFSCYQNPNAFFVSRKKSILKFTWGIKGPQIAKTVLEEQTTFSFLHVYAASHSKHLY